MSAIEIFGLVAGVTGFAALIAVFVVFLFAQLPRPAQWGVLVILGFAVTVGVLAAVLV